MATSDFEKEIEEMLSKMPEPDLVTRLAYDGMEYGCSMYHQDNEGNKRRIQPFSEEWYEVIDKMKKK